MRRTLSILATVNSGLAAVSKSVLQSTGYILPCRCPQERAYFRAITPTHASHPTTKLSPSRSIYDLEFWLPHMGNSTLRPTRGFIALYEAISTGTARHASDSLPHIKHFVASCGQRTRPSLNINNRQTAGRDSVLRIDRLVHHRTEEKGSRNIAVFGSDVSRSTAPVLRA